MFLKRLITLTAPIPVRRIAIVAGLILSLVTSAVGITTTSPNCPMAKQHRGCPQCVSHAAKSEKSCCRNHHELLRVSQTALDNKSMAGPHWLPQLFKSGNTLFFIFDKHSHTTGIIRGDSPPDRNTVLRI